MNEIDDGNIAIPCGEWIDIPAGMLMAPDTFVDDQGHLRSASNGAYCVWHWNRKGMDRCERKEFKLEDITFLPNGAPWCPDCLAKKLEYERLKELFGTAERR